MMQNIKPRITRILLATCAAIAGCDKPPTTTTRDVVDYIRNAEAGAAVRRLDNEAQTYVEHVMRAYGDYEKACEPVADLASRKALWPLHDDDWRDTENVAELRGTLQEWLDDKPDPAEPSSKTRAQRLTELSDAVAEAPAVQVGDGITESKMTADITSRLDVADQEKRYTEIAQGYLALATAAIDHADDFDPASTGLTFTAAALTTRVASTWQNLHDIVEEPLQQELADLTAQAKQDAKLRAEALTKKQSLRSAITTDPKKFRHYRELELLVEYYDAGLKSAEHRIKALEKEAAKKATTKEQEAKQP